MKMRSRLPLILPVLLTSCGPIETDDLALVRSELSSINATPRGFTRSDNKHVVVYRRPSGAIGQLTGPPSQRSFVDLGGQSACAPWGYKRSDGFSATLYIDTSRHVHELGVTSSQNVDFATLGGVNAPLADPTKEISGYVRTDNRNAMVYVGGLCANGLSCGTTGHVIEIASNFGSSPPWLVTDLSAFVGAPSPAGRPAVLQPFVGAQLTNSIVFRKSTNEVIEIRSNFGGPGQAWTWRNITAAASETILAASDPWIYLRVDTGSLAILYVGTDHKLHELLSSGDYWQNWTKGIITAAVNPSTARPTAFLRSEGSRNAVYYVSGTTVHEVSLVSGGSWVDGVLPFGTSTIAVGEPFGFTAYLVSDSLLIQGTTSGSTNGFEFFLPSGGTWGVTSF